MDDWVHMLYQSCAYDLFRIARYRLGEESLAQDLVQEVFLCLLEKEDELKKHPNPRGWLMKTLEYRMFHAVSKRLRESPLEDAETLPAPQERVSLDEVLPTQLSEEDRRLLKLFYEEGRSYQELSALLGVPPATCGTWLYRARNRCKQYLTQAKGGGRL